MSRVAARTRLLFDAGRDVCDGVRGRLRHELRLTWLGGTRILDRLDRVDYNVFMFRPALGVDGRAVAPVARAVWDIAASGAERAGSPATKP